ncbi:chalcone isomerase family protein [Psychrobium sp. MM17-31]|uniref:chalcone isomerase family protein n=1 Tax=Psychrobium sp. MM17-31 TaxID=2917758 RepID=UPI001EF61EA0|nr:chalcone isomerase family protein [Psychrobium sp. MM17-31]MCG7531382.1 chalcone isomerase family protein [Psychrobium sp. MM17-31]
MRSLLLVVSFLFSSIVIANQSLEKDSSSTSKISIEQKLQQLTKLGQGTMKVMFWKVYSAEFFTVNDGYQQNVYPQALKITYLRDIDGEDLVTATDEQWQHLKIDKAQRAPWITLLQPIFPNVTDGDSIVLYVDKQRRSQFYFKPKGGEIKPIGEITNPEFGPAFLAIWLSENTSRPKFRRKLLGASS